MTEEQKGKPLEDFKITIATPHSYDTLYKQWFASYEQLAKPSGTHLRFDPALPLDVNRNQAVEEALKQGSEYLMFIDHDNTMDPMMLVRLLEHDVPVVGALYFERKYPHLPLIYVIPEGAKSLQVVHEYPKGLVRVDGIGLGCSLFNMEVFKTMPAPWFAYEYRGMKWGTEDVAFFFKAKDCGVPVFIDTVHTCGHLTIYEVNEGDWLFHKDAYMEQVEQSAKQFGTKNVFLDKDSMDFKPIKDE